MSRARLAVAAVGAVAALLLATVGILKLGGGHATATPPPLVAGGFATDPPHVGTCGTGCAPSTATGSESAGTTTTMPSLSAGPALASSGALAASVRPKHVLAGYWQDFVNHAASMRLGSVPSGYDLVDVAFASADAKHDGGVTFKLSPALAKALGGYTTMQFAQDISAMHARGQRVLLSVNDAGGAVSIDSPGAAAHFAESVSALMQMYGFDGVDIDFESGLNVAFTAQALRSLAAMQPGVLITLAPQTADMASTDGPYFQLALSIRSILTMSFTQYYNSGTMLGCDGVSRAQSTEDFVTSLACTQLRGGLDPSQVGLGFPASASAARHGYLALPAVNGALGCLATGAGCGSFVPPATWPTLGGAMTWSINWDASNNFEFLRTVSPYLASLP